MGHMYPKTQSEFIQSYLERYEVGTMMEIVFHALAAEQEVSCAEGSYSEFHMLDWAYRVLLTYYVEKGYVIPARQLTEDEMEAWDAWHGPDWDRVDASWHFERQRKKHPELRSVYLIPLRLTGVPIVHLTYLES